MATTGHTDGNIIAAIISTQRTTKNPSEPTENREPMLIVSMRPTLATQAITASAPSTTTATRRRCPAGDAIGTRVLTALRH